MKAFIDIKLVKNHDFTTLKCKMSIKTSQTTKIKYASHTHISSTSLASKNNIMITLLSIEIAKLF